MFLRLQLASTKNADEHVLLRFQLVADEKHEGLTERLIFTGKRQIQCTTLATLTRPSTMTQTPLYCMHGSVCDVGVGAIDFYVCERIACVLR